VVKVVGSEVSPGRLRALYFTRATAPYGEGPLYHHIGLYAYRRERSPASFRCPVAAGKTREARASSARWKPACASIVALVDTVPLGVDTPAELEVARKALAAS